MEKVKFPFKGVGAQQAATSGCQHARTLVYCLAGNGWMETDTHGGDAFGAFGCRDVSPLTSDELFIFGAGCCLNRSQPSPKSWFEKTKQKPQNTLKRCDADYIQHH